MSDAKLGSGVSSDATTEFSLPEILNAHARMETQWGKFMCSLLRLLVNTPTAANVGPQWRWRRADTQRWCARSVEVYFQACLGRSL